MFCILFTFIYCHNQLYVIILSVHSRYKGKNVCSEFMALLIILNRADEALWLSLISNVFLCTWWLEPLLLLISCCMSLHYQHTDHLFCVCIRIMKECWRNVNFMLDFKSFHNCFVEETFLCQLTFRMKSIYSLGITGKQSLYTGKSVYFMSNKGIGKNNLCCT